MVLSRTVACLVVAIGLGTTFCAAADPVPLQLEPSDWSAVEARARGATVYFNAWGGDEAINRYLAWTAGEVQRRYGVRLVHVKVTDVAESVTRILAEAAAGRTSGGSVDLLWLNGENFASLRRARLLYGPWADAVPNARWIDTHGNPTTVTDFTLPTEGFELAWGTARLTLFYDSAVVPIPPRDPAALLDWIRSYPGRFTYPRPPNFLGTSFLKQLLVLLVQDPAALRRPPGPDFDQVTRPLWTWLDAAHPHLWRRGRLFPPSGPAQRELLATGEVDWALAFNPAEARRAIVRGELPQTVRATSFRGGALANSHFLAIPFNTRSRDGAMVVANFLLSAEAQARKANSEVWGDPTILDLTALTVADRSRFDRTEAPDATLSDGPVIVDLHPSWMGALERAWLTRYGVR